MNELRAECRRPPDFQDSSGNPAIGIQAATVKRPPNGGPLRVKSFAFVAIALALVFSGLFVTSTTRGQDLNAVPPNCDRACLVEFMNKYLTALVARDPSRVPWADKV